MSPMLEQSLPCVEINPTVPHKSSIIWLHGLGADGHDFVDVVPQLNLPVDLGVRFVFPHAAVRPITLNGGYPMRAWYDIHGLDLKAREDEEGIRTSALQVEQLIQQEIDRGIEPQRIILAGFSQGGAMALYSGLRYPQRLAGILALSCYLPMATKLSVEASLANRDVPIFMAHGDADNIVDMALATVSHNYLQQAGYHIDFHLYPKMAHGVCQQEVSDAAMWVRRYIAGASNA